MSDETRNVTLGSKTFPIPMLPPIVNRIVFPLCRDLDPLVERTRVEDNGAFRPTQAEYDKVLECIFEAVRYGTPELTKDEFMNHFAMPAEHYEAVLVIRLQTGGWTLAPAAGEGEAKGTA